MAVQAKRQARVTSRKPRGAPAPIRLSCWRGRRPEHAQKPYGSPVLDVIRTPLGRIPSVASD
jgi:hypothetical protein